MQGLRFKGAVEHQFLVAAVFLLKFKFTAIFREARLRVAEEFQNSRSFLQASEVVAAEELTLCLCLRSGLVVG